MPNNTKVNKIFKCLTKRRNHNLTRETFKELGVKSVIYEWFPRNIFKVFWEHEGKKPNYLDMAEKEKKNFKIEVMLS